ncbi:AidA/PixA family protein [Pandoraea terrigena]|uniref:Inclusion body protein n=1 Tax=Pandoraea terrigena TaxID=2508292 RepID=A0A5E4VM58_9BURK|nr:AidA/PixA family protein [Pandoraea terrigena]VVE13362.1 inclusion body protein [Pandoraea terrigena]
MSDAHSSDGERRAIADVLLVIDSATLLDRHPQATDAPVSVDADRCYGLAPDSAALDGVNAAQWRVDAHAGDRLRLRWTPLAIRGEHAVLLELSLDDERTLSGLQLHVHEHATRYAPQSGSFETPVAREAPDAFWQADVVGSGTAALTIEAIVTDRDANVLGRFRWPMRIVVP